MSTTFNRFKLKIKIAEYLTETFGDNEKTDEIMTLYDNFYPTQIPVLNAHLVLCLSDITKTNINWHVDHILSLFDTKHVKPTSRKSLYYPSKTPHEVVRSRSSPNIVLKAKSPVTVARRSVKVDTIPSPSPSPGPSPSPAPIGAWKSPKVGAWKSPRAGAESPSVGAWKSPSARNRQRLESVSPDHDTCESQVAKKSDTRLGAGNFGQVVLKKYKGEEVAVKFLQKDAKYESETTLLELIGCKNPYIGCQITFCKNMEDIPVIIMEHLKGGVLTYDIDHAKNIGTYFGHEPTEYQVLQLFNHLSSGLEYIHSFGIAHGDVKGENIMLNKKYNPSRSLDWTAKFIDFGLSCKDDSCNRKATGTISFFPPEMSYSTQQTLESVKAYDMWAIGVTIWEVMHMRQYDVIFHTGTGPWTKTLLKKHEIIKGDLWETIYDLLDKIMCVAIERLSPSQFLGELKVLGLRS